MKASLAVWIPYVKDLFPDGFNVERFPAGLPAWGGRGLRAARVHTARFPAIWNYSNYCNSIKIIIKNFDYTSSKPPNTRDIATSPKPGDKFRMGFVAVLRVFSVHVSILHTKQVSQDEVSISFEALKVEQIGFHQQLCFPARHPSWFTNKCMFLVVVTCW